MNDRDAIKRHANGWWARNTRMTQILMTLCLGWGALVGVGSCHQDHPHRAPHGGESHALAGEAPGHDHGSDIPSESVTSWGNHTQLFVEFPRLVAGRQSPFVAHLTMLNGHRAASAGRVIVELTAMGRPTERFVVEKPSSAGIFRPAVTPRHAGGCTVKLTFESEQVSEVHALGEFMVFADEKEAMGTGGAPEEGPTISFLLEQQWLVPFGVEQARLKPIRPTIGVFGEISRPDDAQLWVAAPKAGRLINPAALSPGMRVEWGAPMFTVGGFPTEGADPAALDLAVDQAEIRVKAANREVERLRPLVTQGVVPEKRLVDAKTALAEAAAEQGAARRRRAQLEQSQKIDGDLDGFMVVAPMGGVVAESRVVAGAWVEAGDPLVRIVDSSRMWLDVFVPEGTAHRLKSISGVLFRVDKNQDWVELNSPDLVFVGTEVEPETRALPVRFRLNNAESLWISGMSVEARLFAEPAREALVVPLDAIIDDSGSDVVYVQTGGESFERRPVRLGIQEGSQVEILSGIEVGEWIVVKGAYSVRLASLSTESLGHGHAH